MPGVHKRVIHELLRPRQWKPNHEDRRFMLSVGLARGRLARLAVCLWGPGSSVDAPRAVRGLGSKLLLTTSSNTHQYPSFFFTNQADEIVELCENAEKLFQGEKSVLVRLGIFFWGGGV
jgi:hypothetical protein